MGSINTALFAENYNRKFLHIEELDENVSADFLISSIMLEQFRVNRDAGLCLILFHSTLTHFNSICMRPNIRLSLTDLEQENRMVCIQALDLLTDTFNKDKISILDKDNNLSSLYSSIEAGIKKLLGNNVSHIYVVIESLSNLFYLSYSFKSVLNFFQSCYHFTTNEEKFTMVVSSHVSEANEEQQLFSTFLKHLADINFKVTGLKTGFSSQISGNFIIERKISSPYNFSIKKDKFFFKLQDNSVLIFDGVAPNFLQ